MKNLKIWYAFPVLLLMVVFTSACNKDDELTLDFDITIPDNWVGYTIASQGLVYTANRTAVDAQDTLAEYLAVYQEPLEGYNLNTYYNALKNLLLEADEFESMLEEKDTTINGEPSKRMIYSETGYYITQERDTFDLNLITTRYCFFKNSKGYNINFVTIDTLFYDNKPVFDEIIGSFVFKN